MARLFFPQYQKSREGIPLSPGLTILEHAQQGEIEINAECGGNGTCGKCIVRIEQGGEFLNRKTPEEEKTALGEKERLACRASVGRDGGDIVAFIKNFGRYEILKHGLQRKIPLRPRYTKKDGTVRCDGVEIDRYRGAIYGIAVDIGTTTVVFDLVDLENGDILATMARTNPQISYGNDVISRIEFILVDKKEHRYHGPDEKKERSRVLQQTIVQAINDSLAELSRRLGNDVGELIYETVIVGNPTMRNLFFGLDVSSLGLHPFEPDHTEAVVRPPKEIGLSVNPSGSIYGAPLIGGHVGADTLANVLATGIALTDGVCMIIDIGTNGEIVVGNKDRLLSASAAAGGAFEGATVGCGVGAIEGAIKEIRFEDGRIVYSTIGNKHPVGIVGSGFIDLLAGMLDHGIMTQRARITGDYHITAELKVTQDDIFRLVTSKAAIKTAEEILMKLYPAAPERLDKVYLSGGFGNYINAAHAAHLGIIPPVPESTVVKIGNGALEGAREMLVCLDCRILGEKIARRIEHVKTNEVEPDFDFMVARNMYFEPDEG